MAKELSERKLAAQRQNAQKSTGPRTLEGKATVSLNAVKSGLTAETTIITGRRGKEDPEVFEAHKAYIWNDCAPVGFHEEYIVGEIIRITWRLPRADRFENGCIRSRMKHARGDVEILASSLPESEPLRLTQRYQTTLWRRLDKLFKDLERLQRRRKRAERRLPVGPSASRIGGQVVPLGVKNDSSSESAS